MGGITADRRYFGTEVFMGLFDFLIVVQGIIAASLRSPSRWLCCGSG